MTEEEWLVCADPAPMLGELRGTGSDRKLRLFACVCCRKVWHLLDEPARRAVATAERYADGAASDTEREEDRRVAQAARESNPDPKRIRRGVLRSASETLSPEAINSAVYTAHIAPVGENKAKRQEQAALLRDIFGNPFRPVTFDPAWRTDTVLALARQMYASREFSAMPILADALQDAGCDNPDVLNHCRSEGTHVRGCWLVDLVLGKE